jgi:hypothetical protein
MSFPIISPQCGGASPCTVILHLSTDMYAPPLSVRAIGLSDQTWSALLIAAQQGRLPRTFR